jgi:tRNA-dihydrouridine synthase B
MQIGDLFLDHPILAAPMAGITDKAFRILARKAGAALTFTEMVSAKGVVYGNRNSLALISLAGEPGPVAVQLFGSEPELMAIAARLAVTRGACLIDINMGCPVPKIVKNGEGACLMRHEALAVEIVRAVKQAVSVPVTVKMRKGWDAACVNAVALSRQVAAAGADAVTVHGRTRDQFYEGQADWKIIQDVKAAVSIPVIGNGDLWSPADALRMMSQTGCDAVMLARGTLGNPWLFTRTVNLLASGVDGPLPTLRERYRKVLQHLQLVIADKGEPRAIREMRKHLGWYVKGLPRAARVRVLLHRLETFEQVEAALQSYFLEVAPGLKKRG